MLAGWTSFTTCTLLTALTFLPQHFLEGGVVGEGQEVELGAELDLVIAGVTAGAGGPGNTKFNE